MATRTALDVLDVASKKYDENVEQREWRTPDAPPDGPAVDRGHGRAPGWALSGTPHGAGPSDRSPPASGDVPASVVPKRVQPRAVLLPKPGLLAFAHKWKRPGQSLYYRLLNEWPAFITFGTFTMFIPHVTRFPYGFPNHWQLMGFTAAYCTGGQVLNNGDVGFGSTLLAATGLSHVMCFGRRALKSQAATRFPLYLTYFAATNAAIYAPAALKYSASVLTRRESLVPRETVRLLTA